ncbi:hypothetical protein RJ639_033039 [Escallonia herrerae]|uniref:Amino acid transporter transmembrane domain-containing protein n=1 Tax=Escallonia herrerae TaxID=1293975 RepID=A0AA89B9I4_9ASTE|nr:hypothetical protein RJ639_033039 [Escallonia herrerae]
MLPLPLSDPGPSMGTQDPSDEKSFVSGPAPPYDNSKMTSSTDERTAEQKAIDDWLPITSSRNAKWWYSAFHNVTAMVGAGVLSLPYAMASLGW